MILFAYTNAYVVSAGDSLYTLFTRDPNFFYGQVQDMRMYGIPIQSNMHSHKWRHKYRNIILV